MGRSGLTLSDRRTFIPKVPASSRYRLAKVGEPFATCPPNLAKAFGKWRHGPQDWFSCCLGHSRSRRLQQPAVDYPRFFLPGGE